MAQTSNLDTAAKRAAYKQYQQEEGKKTKKQKVKPAPVNDGDGNDSEDLPDNEKANRNIFAPGSFGESNYEANKQGGTANAGFAYQGPGATEYPAASPFVMNALKKKPGDRTSAETAEINNRTRAEEIAVKRGQRIAGGGISKDLIAADVGAQAGRREGTAAVAYHDASEETLAAAGRGPNGQKLPATPSGGGYSPPVSDGGQDDRPAPGSPGMTHTGFAMRTLADGTVRGASPDGNGGTTLRNFNTQADAMAFYRPPAPPAPVAPQIPAGMDWRSQAALISVGQPMRQPEAPQPVASAPIAQPSPVAPAPAPVVAPAPTSLQTTEAAKTTSPTTQLQMNAPTPGATPQPAAIPAAAPAPVAAAPAPAPVNPFSMAGAPQSSIATPLPNGAGFDLMPGIEALRARDAARTLQTNREMGTPKKTGYQAMAEELNPYGQ